MNEFYLSEAWIRKRKHILLRDRYQCRECRKYGRLTEATEVHHIKHLDEFPELALVDDNLVSLCHACHNKQHPEKSMGMRRGYSPQRGRNAEPRR